MFHGIQVHGIHQEDTHQFSSQIEDRLKTLYKRLGVRFYVLGTDLSGLGAEAQGAGG